MVSKILASIMKQHSHIFNITGILKILRTALKKVLKTNNHLHLKKERQLKTHRRKEISLLRYA